MNLIGDIVINMMKIKKTGRLFFFVFEYLIYKEIEQKITITKWLLIFKRHQGITKKGIYKKNFNKADLKIYPYLRLHMKTMC